MADCEVDPWAFSRKGKLEGSEVFIGGGVTAPVYSVLYFRRVYADDCRPAGILCMNRINFASHLRFPGYK